ncbi:biotin/lipoyl-binding protein [Candidatus Woesearchaeota archaeon]|nr:biotin/lipoyl-binding protein [Candidatus Woesearchaeota archaeon]
MAFEFKFPDVGEGITEGTVVEWLVKEGDAVKSDQILVKVETDKAIVEIPSPKAGKILTIHAKAGEVIKVDAVLVTIEEAKRK